jgi:uncharacterized protein
MHLFYDPTTRQPGALVRGHLLWYELREAPRYGAWSGWALLLLVAVLELGLGPRMSGLAYFGVEPPAPALRNAILNVLALAGAFLIARVKPGDIGLVANWRAAEILYLLQILIIAPVIFYLLFGAQLGLVDGDRSALLAVGGMVGVNMLWGFYQELIYRGMLQTELSRRFGAVAGALIANLAFTFGPLHFYHLERFAADPIGTSIVMAAIFGIGLVFAIVFGRSRNLLLVGLLHGIGNVFGNVGALM